jgi:hypothetical protein
MMGWANPVALAVGGSAALYWGINVAADNQVQMGFNSGPPPHFLIYVTNGFAGVGATNLVAGTWYHLCAVVDGTGTNQVRGYLNGVQEVQGNGNPSQAPTVFQVGRAGPSGDPFNGSVAAVKWWNVALTADEVRQEMRQYVPSVRLANCYLWAPLLTHTDVQDYTGRPALTAQGTLTTEDGPPIAWTARQPTTAFRVGAAIPPPKAPPPYHRPWRTWRRVA